MKPAPCIGFISPPDWIDPSPAEFKTDCVDDTNVQQQSLALPNFDWRLDSIARSEPELVGAARALGRLGCDIVANVGTPFAWAGLASIGAARARADRLAAVAGVPVVMSGIAIIDALRMLGAERVALACTYYTEDWTAQWARFVHASGVDVVRAENLTQQGLTAAHDPADPNFWTPTIDQIRVSVRRIAKAAPSAHAIVVSGAGVHTQQYAIGPGAPAPGWPGPGQTTRASPSRCPASGSSPRGAHRRCSCRPA